MSPKWMDVAYGELGQKEVPGQKDNPRIIEYHSKTTLKATDDEVPWCSSFVNWCFSKVGINGTGSARAISWKDWGVASELKPGAVCVKSRTGGNHVFFFAGFQKRNGVDGCIALGGNQGDRVCENWYPLSVINHARWPKGEK
jgi:uncharacterized protein (TIGR02594 family)